MGRVCSFHHLPGLVGAEDGDLARLLGPPLPLTLGSRLDPDLLQDARHLIRDGVVPDEGKHAGILLHSIA